jgi:hypothetical protein
VFHPSIHLPAVIKSIQMRQKPQRRLFRTVMLYKAPNGQRRLAHSTSELRPCRNSQWSAKRL